MPGVGDLIRTIRTNPGTSGDLMSDLVRKMKGGELSPGELIDVKSLLESPEFKDKFSPTDRAVVVRLLSGGGADIPMPAGLPHRVDDVLPDFQALHRANELPDRFASDLVMVKPQLVDHPALPRDERANRLVEFLARYIEHFVELSDGRVPTQPGQKLALAPVPAPAPESAKLPQMDRAPIQKKFVEVARAAGFGEVVDTRSGKSVIDLLPAWLQVTKKEDVRSLLQGYRFDAPTWQGDAGALARAMPKAPELPSVASMLQKPDEALHYDKDFRAQPGLGIKVDSAIRGPLSTDPTPHAGEPEKVKGRQRTDKVLGRNMIWNVLHKFRGDEEHLLAEKMSHGDLQKLMVGGFIAIVGLGIALIVLLNF